MIDYQDHLKGITKRQLKGFFVGWKAPLSSETHLEILKNSTFFILAIDKNTKQVIGFINTLSDQIHFAFIPMLEVLPNYQNQGIGTKLLNLMLEKLKPISNIDLTCDENMQSFYKRFHMLQSHGMVIRKCMNK